MGGRAFVRYVVKLFFFPSSSATKSPPQLYVPACYTVVSSEGGTDRLRVRRVEARVVSAVDHEPSSVGRKGRAILRRNPGRGRNRVVSARCPFFSSSPDPACTLSGRRSSCKCARCSAVSSSVPMSLGTNCKPSRPTETVSGTCGQQRGCEMRRKRGRREVLTAR